MLTRAHDLLRDRCGFFFVTLQLETTCLDEGAAAEIDVTRLPGSPNGMGHDGGYADGTGPHGVAETE